MIKTIQCPAWIVNDVDEQMNTRPPIPKANEDGEEVYNGDPACKNNTCLAQDPKINSVNTEKGDTVEIGPAEVEERTNDTDITVREVPCILPIASATL